jgi:hypothetical protein
MRPEFIPTIAEKLLIIDVNSINFVDNPELGMILNKINAELNGLF